MHALTLDHLSGGRHILGLGVSGPQVVEGWYGQPFGKPLARTREYVQIIRDVLAREAPVRSPGPHYPLPYHGPNSLGFGKALRPITHPLRADLPIWLGTEGPKNVALTAEIADGWLAIYFSPRVAKLYNGWLDEGFSRPQARQTRAGFEIAASCNIHVTSDPETTLDAMKPHVAFYIGGMGAREMNFHKEVYVRMGYEKEVEEIQQLFLEGKREEAVKAVPTSMVAETALVGPREQIRDQLAAWREAGVTMLVTGARTPQEMRSVAEAVLDT
jgi:F420-dependent oxidoreductase-like protein